MGTLTPGGWAVLTAVGRSAHRRSRPPLPPHAARRRHIRYLAGYDSYDNGE